MYVFVRDLTSNLFDLEVPGCTSYRGSQA